MKTIEVAAGLIFRDGKLLISQRAAGSHLEGLWEFPGGKVEPFESYEECLIRELREELGIEVRVGEMIESVTHEYPEKIVHLKFFRCEWARHEPRALHCPAFKWITAPELANYSFPAADTRILQKLAGSPQLWSW